MADRPAVRIDAHHHLWELAARPHPFLDGAAMGPVRRDYGLADLRAKAASADVDRTVLVQTVADQAETEDFLALAASSGGLVGAVVGWVDLTHPDVAARLAALRGGAGGSMLRGIRHPAQAEPDPRWLARDDVSRGLAAVTATGLTYDLLVKRPQWAPALEVARELAGAALVLDHAGNPPIAAGDLAEWQGWLRELAATGPHVSVKLSGLVTCADWERWTARDLRPVVEAVLDAFGPSRVMAGSDWPICELAATYEQVWEAHDALLGRLDEAERASVLGGTAARVYRIEG